MQLENQEKVDRKVQPGPSKVELSANDDRHDRYRSWVVLLVWIIEKIIKKGG